MTQIIGIALASRTDSRGYTITITDHVKEQHVGSSVVRRGSIWITHPDKTIVKSGYWMDWPEADMPEKDYEVMLLRERAALECWHQVERYSGLACDFEHAIFGEWLPMDTFEDRLRDRFVDVWKKNPRMYKFEVWHTFFKWAESVVKRKKFLKKFPDKFPFATSLDIAAIRKEAASVIDRLADDEPIRSDASSVPVVAHETPTAPPGQSSPDAPENASGKLGAPCPFLSILTKLSDIVSEYEDQLSGNAAGAAARHILRHWHDTYRDHTPALAMFKFKQSIKDDLIETHGVFQELRMRFNEVLKVVKEDYPPTPEKQEKSPEVLAQLKAAEDRWKNGPRPHGGI